MSLESRACELHSDRASPPHTAPSAGPCTQPHKHLLFEGGLSVLVDVLNCHIRTVHLITLHTMNKAS